MTGLFAVLLLAMFLAALLVSFIGRNRKMKREEAELLTAIRSFSEEETGENK